MLTVRYERLELQAGMRLLDLGCGGGRHAFEAARRGVGVVALDADLAEIKDVAAMFSVLSQETPIEGRAVGGDALHLPFPDGCFDRVIAAEVLEHLPDEESAMGELVRVLAPGGILAVTVPAWLPERVCWALSDDYHAPAVPGGHVRIYSAARLRALLAQAGVPVFTTHRAHALHSPYWWLRCAVGPADDAHPLVRLYHRLLVWDITRRHWATRTFDAVLNPILGKSLVVYARKDPAPKGHG